MDFSDDFERPNGAPGSPWTFAGAGTWAIVAGKLVHTAGVGLDAAVVDVGESDVNVITPLFGANTGQFLRYIDLNNTLMVVAGNGPTSDGLWKIVAGVSTRIMATVAILGNATLEVLCVGDTVRITSNDVVLGTHTMSVPEAAQFTTPTKFGLRAFSGQQQAHESFAVSRYIGNVETYPADVDLDVAVNGFGINLTSAAFARWAYDAAQAHGATEIRWTFGWEFCETAPGVYGGTEVPAVVAAMQWCAELGLKPLLVASFGPPRAALQTVHVNGSHPIGSTSLTFDEDLNFDLELGRDFIGAPGLGLGKAAYYGAVIADMPSANVVELGAATTGVIADGTALTINRLMYPAIATDSGTDPSAVAYANYAHALAELIADHCPAGGAVELWNEPVWNNDRWDQLANFFDDPTAWSVAEWDQLLSPIIKAVAGMDWPAGVDVYSSGNNKTGQMSALLVLDKAALVPIVADTYHPYDVEPEAYWWGRGPTCTGTNWGPGYKNVVGSSSFAAGALVGDAAGGFGRRISECGYGGTHGDTDWLEGLKSYAIRKLVGAWSMGFEMVNFYSLIDAPYALADPVTHEPYPALVRLGQLMRFLRNVQADADAYTLPTIRFYDGALPLFRVNIGPVLVCWQRTAAGAAPTYKPQWPVPDHVRFADEPGGQLRVLNTVRRLHESVNAGEAGEHTLYFGAEPLVVTWKAA